MDRFELLGPLPREGTTTVLEASAGTGKTFALAGLVTRYLAETAATLDEMLLITFNRAASRELRERVRGQIVEAVGALQGDAPPSGELVEHLLRGSDAERAQKRSRLRDALANFDAATIATTHEFCGSVLKSLGVAGDNAADVELKESLTDLVTEIVDDRYLANFGRQETDPELTYAEALALALAVVDDPCAQLRPPDPEPGSKAAVRLRFAAEVLEELERRKGRLRAQGFNDLLIRLATALEAADSPARDRMRERWRIVLVDEFQDTDPMQWRVLERAFSRHSALILIGDPKQAIYGFRGGDIHTYLKAAGTADARYTLGVNWRSDRALVESLQTVLRDATLGHADIVVRGTDAHHAGHRLASAPRPAPFRLRVVKRHTLGYDGTAHVPIEALRRHIPDDLAADVAALLASGATFAGRPVVAADIAVIVEHHKDARACRNALAEAGIPAIYTGDTDVFASQAAKDWLCLLEAFDAPQRSGLVRAAACTMFFGETAESLAAEGDALTDRVAGTLREWADHARHRGVAAVFQAAQLAGMGRRVLSQRGGERDLTDLAHIAQLLHEAAHRERLGLPGLRDWLRRQAKAGAGPPEHNRRLDSDAAAVQIMTVFVAKGLQFPIVYLPFAFNRNVRSDDILLYHDDGTRCLYIGGKDGGAQRRTVEGLNRVEAAHDNLRLTYVALTRAQSQVVAWWAPTFDEVNGGLSRLLRGRRPGQSQVPDLYTTRHRRAGLGGVRAVGGRGRAVGRGIGHRCSQFPRKAGARTRFRGSALSPPDRHHVAADLVLGSGAGLGSRHRHQRAGGRRPCGRGGDRRRRRARFRRRSDITAGRAAVGGVVRLAGARGARDRGPSRSRSGCRTGSPGAPARAVVDRGRRPRAAGSRTGPSVAADARHAAGTRRRRTDIAADRCA